ncbi:FAS1 domain-containing protein [Pycnococcus provasolii]
MRSRSLTGGGGGGGGGFFTAVAAAEEEASYPYRHANHDESRRRRRSSSRQFNNTTTQAEDNAFYTTKTLIDPTVNTNYPFYHPQQQQQQSPSSSCTFTITTSNGPPEIVEIVRGYRNGNLVRDLYKEYPAIKPGSLSILERALDETGNTDDAGAFYALFLDGYPINLINPPPVTNEGRDYERTFLAFTDKAFRKLLKVSALSLEELFTTSRDDLIRILNYHTWRQVVANKFMIGTEGTANANNPGTSNSDPDFRLDVGVRPGTLGGAHINAQSLPVSGPLLTAQLLDGDFVSTSVDNTKPGSPVIPGVDREQGDAYFATQQRISIRRLVGQKRVVSAFGFPFREDSGISQDFTDRPSGTRVPYLRGAMFQIPNLLLCDGNLAVHIVDEVAIPYTGFFPDYLSIICSLPELELTCEACRRAPWACDGNPLTGPPQNSFVQKGNPGDTAPPGNTANSRGLRLPETAVGGRTFFTGYCPARRGSSLNQPPASVVPWLDINFVNFPINQPGDFGPFNEVTGSLPQAGFVGNTQPIPALYMNNFFAPTNDAWYKLFQAIQVTKETLFNDIYVLGEFLMYHQASPTEGVRQILDFQARSNIEVGAVPTQRYFQGELFATHLGWWLSQRPPRQNPSIDSTATVFNLRVDISEQPYGERYYSFSPQFVRAFDTSYPNNFKIVGPDIFACNGIVQVVDTVLLHPLFSPYERMRLVPKVSLFRHLLEIPSFSRDIPGANGPNRFTGLLFQNFAGGVNVEQKVWDCCPSRFYVGPTVNGLPSCGVDSLRFLDGIPQSSTFDIFRLNRCNYVTVYVPSNEALLKGLRYLDLSYEDLTRESVQAWAYRGQIALYHTAQIAGDRFGTRFFSFAIRDFFDAAAFLLSLGSFELEFQLTSNLRDFQQIATLLRSWDRWFDLTNRALSFPENALRQGCVRLIPCNRILVPCSISGTTGSAINRWREYLWIRRFPKAGAVSTLLLPNGIAPVIVPEDDIYILGDTNGAKLLRPLTNLVASSGSVHVINALLFPPILQPSLWFRMKRTPSVTIFLSLIEALGMEDDIMRYPLNAFVPTDHAMLLFFKERGITKEDLFTPRGRQATYDLVNYHLAPGRTFDGFGPRDCPRVGVVVPQGQAFLQWDCLARHVALTYGMLFPGRRIYSVLNFYWETIRIPDIATLVVQRVDTKRLPLSGGSRMYATKEEYPLTSPALVSTTVRLQGARNGAQIVPPYSQNASNGMLHVIDTVLLPPREPTCTKWNVEYFGRDGIAYSYDPVRIGPSNFQPQPPRRNIFANESACTEFPCTYYVCELFRRVAFESVPNRVISIEVTATWDPTGTPCQILCPPGAGWLCLPCQGYSSQVLVMLGGCALDQPQCGGSFVVYVNDMGEIRFGIQPILYSFFMNAGVQWITSSILAKGYIVRPGKRFKVLATWDPACDVAKIYVNDKLRAVGNFNLPYQRAARAQWYNVTSSRFRIVRNIFDIGVPQGLTQALVTIGDGTHGFVNFPSAISDAGTTDCPSVPEALLGAAKSRRAGSGQRDDSTSRATAKAAYTANSGSVAGGLGPPGSSIGASAFTYKRWRGPIYRALVTFMGVPAYPSACAYPPPEFIDVLNTRRFRQQQQEGRKSAEQNNGGGGGANDGGGGGGANDGGGGAHQEEEEDLVVSAPPDDDDEKKKEEEEEEDNDDDVSLWTTSL